MIYVVATIQLTSGHRDEFLALQKDLLPLVLCRERLCRIRPEHRGALGRSSEVDCERQRRGDARTLGNARRPQGPFGGSAHGRLPTEVESPVAGREDRGLQVGLATKQITTSGDVPARDSFAPSLPFTHLLPSSKQTET